MIINYIVLSLSLFLLGLIHPRDQSLSQFGPVMENSGILGLIETRSLAFWGTWQWMVAWFSGEVHRLLNLIFWAGICALPYVNLRK